MEDVLGSFALLLTMLMSLAVVICFCCSTADILLKMRHRHKKHKYKALLRENQRLKSLLAETAREHRLRKIHHTEAVRRKTSRASRNVA